MAADDTTINPAAPAVQTVPAVGQLSFTGRRDDDGIDLWRPTNIPTEWAEQCRIGREYGREAAGFIRETKNAAMLPGIVRAIAERGRVGGVEVGFFAAIAMTLAEPA